MTDVDEGGGFAQKGIERMRELSVPFSQLCPKNEKLKKMSLKNFVVPESKEVSTLKCACIRVCVRAQTHTVMEGYQKDIENGVLLKTLVMETICSKGGTI